MKSNELLYQYAYDCYRDSLESKKEIRNRSSFFVGFGIPVLISLATASLATRGSEYGEKLIFVIAGGFLALISLLFFFLIYAPSSQKTYTISGLQKSIEANINESHLKEGSVESDLAYRYFTDVYGKIVEEYEKKNRDFKIFFIHLFVTLILGAICMAVSFVF